MEGKNINPALLQGVILALMLMVMPYAMTLMPYEGVYNYEGQYPRLDLDHLYVLRAGLIIAGLLGAILSLVFLGWGLLGRGKTGSGVVLQISMAICSSCIGWAAFPYWVNGVFQAYLGHAPKPYLSLFDPKRLMPMIWIGEIWRLGVLLILAAAVFAGPILLFFNLLTAIKYRTWKQSIATILCLTITAAVLFFSPKYWGWFID
jgi:hypothetical protein